MSSDHLLNYCKNLLESSSTNDVTLLQCINKLAKVSVTEKSLNDSGILYSVNALCNHSGKIGINAKSLLERWKEKYNIEFYSDEEGDIFTDIDHIEDNLIEYECIDETELMEEVIEERRLNSQSEIKAIQIIELGEDEQLELDELPTLYELCTKHLQNNLDNIILTDSVQLDVLMPVLEHATADQLFRFEKQTPDLIIEDDILWKNHCTKKFKTKKRMDMETWRDMYLRCKDEQARLKSLTENIKRGELLNPRKQIKIDRVDIINGSSKLVEPVVTPKIENKLFKITGIASLNTKHDDSINNSNVQIKTVTDLDEEKEQEITVLLLRFIRENEVLYDLQNLNFRNNNLRKKIWEDIGEKMMMNSADCQARWRNLKKRYKTLINTRTPVHRLTPIQKLLMKEMNFVSKNSMKENVQETKVTSDDNESNSDINYDESSFQPPTESIFLKENFIDDTTNVTTNFFEKLKENDSLVEINDDYNGNDSLTSNNYVSQQPGNTKQIKSETANSLSKENSSLRIDHSLELNASPPTKKQKRNSPEDSLPDIIGELNQTLKSYQAVVEHNIASIDPFFVSFARDVAKLDERQQLQIKMECMKIIFKYVD